MLKNYDWTILYHPGKANVVGDAQSRKSRGRISALSSKEKYNFGHEPLAVAINVRGGKGYLAHLGVQPSLIEKIKEAQVLDPELKDICASVWGGENPEFRIDKLSGV